MLRHLRKIDWQIFISVLLICGIGLLSLWSISLGRGNFLILKKQIIFLSIGIFLMFFLSFLDWRMFRENPYFILTLYFFCVLLLIGLFFFAPSIRGTRGWYRIGKISFDPVEFTKIVLIILLAKYFSMRHVEMYKLRHILLSGFYVLIPAVLVFFQPNFGSAMILVFLWVGILIISGIKLRHFFLLFLVFLIFLSLGWTFLLKDYQKERIVGFLFPEIEPLGIGWSQNQSKIAIGSGGLFGQGFGKGSQTQYGFLPEPHTDFIFSAIAEEMGLMGVLILLFLFVFLVYRIIKIALFSQSNFPRLFASGFVIILFSQIFIHIGMNLGLLPVVGISLPFVSYGGSSLITLFMGLGILQSIKTH